MFLDGALHLAALNNRPMNCSAGRFLLRFLPVLEVAVELPYFSSEAGLGSGGGCIGQLSEFFLDFGRGCPPHRGCDRVVGLRALPENGVHHRD